MPFAPAVNYRGDQYIYSGIMGAANTISDSLSRTLLQLEQAKRENAFGDTVIQKLAQVQSPTGQPYVPADLLLKYEQGNRSTKMGIVQGALANAHFDAERQTAQAVAAWHAAQANRAEAQANNLWSGGTDEGAVTPVQILPYNDPVTGKSVEGIGIVKGGGNQFQVVRTGTDEPQQFTDPSSGVIYRKTATGDWKALSASEIIGGKIAAEKSNSQATGNSTFNVTPNQPTPTPTPTATPTPPPGKVRVISPQGQAGWIPAERLQDYITAGYRQG
jgi:hypothetical protein